MSHHRGFRGKIEQEANEDIGGVVIAEKNTRNPFIAALLSLVVPGLG